MLFFLGSGEVCMVYFGSGVYERYFSIILSNLFIVLFLLFCFLDLLSMVIVNSVGVIDYIGRLFVGELVEVVFVGYVCYIIYEECEKLWNERIISFDEVSEWLKKISLLGNNVC